MVRKILSLITLLFVITAFGQQRSTKDIEKMFKGISDVEAITNGYSYQDGNILKTIILSEGTPNLNDIERQLIADYAQVALMCNMSGKPLQCYFVKDKDNKRGLVGLDGKIIVPPLSGNICNIPNGKDMGILVVGELSRPTAHQLLMDWGNLQLSKENDILGLFSAIVVDSDKPSIHNLLPIGEYIFLSLGSKGNGKFDIFTLKAVGDDALWGIVDMKGKEIMPNKYTGFTRKSHILDTTNSGLWGKWVGTTEMDMTEALQYSKNLKAETQRRRMELAGTLNSIGETMINTAQTIETVQNASANTHSNSDDVENSNNDSNSGQKGKSSMSEQQHYNSDKSTYNKYDSMLSQVFAGNRSASASEIKNWQSKMKELRTKWEAKGKSFPHSANEDR